jgi:endonuclease I
MNRCHVLFLTLLVVCTRLHAQTVTLSSPVRFDTVLVNTTDSLSFWVRNAGATPFTVTDINTTRPEFRVKDTSFAVPAHDSVRVYVYFMTNQNVTWNDVLLVTGVGLQGALPLRWSGTGRYSDVFYNSTQGLWENALKTALTNLVTNHTALGYNTARDRMFETIDDFNLTDTVECVYIGRRIRATTRTEAQNQNFNTEHTWPQSFFSSNEPMVSDLNHLFPTDAAPNSARANFPFGPVVSNVTYNVGGSKLGFRADGTSAFEPRDIHKGDVARALFYFAIRYGNLGNYMDATQESDLRVWYKSDPVSGKEIQRNNRVATYQGKRNPLIDHPEFIDRISYFRISTAPALSPDISTSTTAINFGTIASGDSVEWKLVIINNGRASLNITGLTLQSSSSIFRIIDTPTSVPVDSFAQVRVRFVPPQMNQAYTNTLVIHSNDPDEGTVNIPLAGSSTAASTTTTLSTPVQSAMGVPIPVLFTWFRTQGADRFHLQASTTNTFASFVADDSSLVDSSSSLAGLGLNTTYYWRVRSHTGGGWGTYSEVRSFTTWNALAQVQLELPPDHVHGIPAPVRCAWQRIPVATVYHIEVSANESFATLMASDSTLHDTTYVVPGLDTLSTYYWHVRAKTSAGWGEFSPAWQFRIAAALAVSAQMNAGWNIVSLPVLPGSSAVTSIFPTAVSAAYAYANGYVQRDTLTPGLGYWLKFGTSQSVSISGEPMSADTIEVNGGWNLVGPMSSPLSVDSIATSPPGIIMSSFYEFNGGYVSSATLLPLRGYWVHCSQQGRIFRQNSGPDRH